MNTITLLNPNKIDFGNGSLSNFIDDFLELGYKKLFVVTASIILPLIESSLKKLKGRNIEVNVFDKIESEPTFKMFTNVLSVARDFDTDSVVGIGGGSVLDVSKLIAALLNSKQSIEEIIGIGNLKSRQVYLACVPTTSGTGSEVSPNAILLDESDKLKKGVVSPYLVPDASYIDPLLTLSVPPEVTASTGLDALIHCIEAYTNKFAHPIINHCAIKGIELIATHLETAYKDGSNKVAREALSLGSLYGGICLGPVNTAAVHALSYPLGGEFHIPHGLSNALLLPYIMRFNMESVPSRYAQVALALGAKQGKNDMETASNGVDKIFELCKKVKIPLKLSEMNIPEEAIDRMAEAAMKVTRLLKNNPREVTFEDAKKIYSEAY
jgi:alcohol dehydrogenase class IV